MDSQSCGCCDSVISFWAAIAILGLYAYPTPESPTPSFQDHTAFNGVAFGIVSVYHVLFDRLCFANLLLVTTIDQDSCFGYSVSTCSSSAFSCMFSECIFFLLELNASLLAQPCRT